MDQLFVVKQVESNNKGLFSKKALQKNQQIMQCQPIAWATLQLTKTKNCNWCFLEKQLVKCSQCKCFYYCSEECQKNDWKYHKIECNIFKKMCNDKNLSIHNQISTQFVLNVRLYFVLKENKQLADRFYSMCSLDDYQPLQKRQHFQQLSLVMMENLSIEKNEANMSQLIKQFNIVAINAFTVQDLFYTTDGIAVGIYWPVNYLNHACNANSTQVFDGRFLKVITNRKIEQDEELTISYTSPLELQKNRDKFLKENYLFECFCEMCQVQKMVNTEYVYIKCPQCKEAMIRKKNSVQSIEQNFQEMQIKQYKQEKRIMAKSLYECSKCKKDIDNQFLTQMAAKIQALPQVAEKAKSYKQKKQQVLGLKKQFDLKHPAFCRALQTVYLSAIDEAMLSESDKDTKKYFGQANILLNQIIKNLPGWYKVEQDELISIRFFSKFNEMSKLAYNMNKLPKCLQYLQKSMKSIQKLSLKNKYKEIQELKTRYDEVKIQISMAKAKVLN